MSASLPSSDDIAARFAAGDTAGGREALMAWREALAGLREENATLRARVTALEAGAGQALVYRDGVYWAPDAAAGDTPFCQFCHDSEQRRCRLQSQEVLGGATRHWWCVTCGSQYVRQ